MSETLALVNSWLEPVFAYGPLWVYAVIFLACFIENLIPPFPGDSFILAAGALTALGRLDLVPTFFVIVLGGVSSVMLLYLVGARFGRGWVLRRNLPFFTSDDLSRVEATLKRWGPLLLIGSRFLFGIRSVVAVVAGIASYPLTQMALFTTLSYCVFVSVWLYLAREIVVNIEEIDRFVKTYDLIVWPLAGLLAGWFLYVRLRRNGKETG